MKKQSTDVEVAKASDPSPARRGPLSLVPRFDQEIERFLGDRWPQMFDTPFHRSSIDMTVPKVDVVDREMTWSYALNFPGSTRKKSMYR